MTFGNVGVQQKRILVIDPFLPLYDRNSGSLRLLRIIEMLVADGHVLTYLAHTIMEGHLGYSDRLAANGVHVIDPSVRTITEARIEQALSNKPYDIVLISFYATARQYLPLIRRIQPHAEIIIDTVDLHFVREQRTAQTTNDQVCLTRSRQTEQDELGTYAQADALIAITPVEQRILQDRVPNVATYIIPNIHVMANAQTAPYSVRQGLLFIGNFWHQPNADGIWWFCNEVLPLVRAALPAVPVTIIGQNPPNALYAFAQQGVHVLGWVEDTTPFLQSCRLSIAPLRHGAGLKGKVGEAMAAGLPVVATPIAVEGMDIIDRQHVMVGDGAQAFARATVEAYQNQQLWEQLSQSGQAYIASHYTVDAVRAMVRSVFGVSPTASVYFAGVPDWNDVETNKHVLDAYVSVFAYSTSARFDLIIRGNDIEPNTALALLGAWLVELGHNPELVPDISLSCMPAANLNKLPPDAIWVPMDKTVDKPSQLTSMETFTISPASHP